MVTINVSALARRRRRAITDNQPMSFKLNRLKYFTNYTARVLAVTIKEGIPTLKMNFMTAEGGKCCLIAVSISQIVFTFDNKR